MGGFMDYITIKEAAKMWGISVRAVTYHVVAARVSGALKKGNMWLIPAASKRPLDKCRKPSSEQNA